MRSLIAAIAACIMLCAQVSAATLDSTISGVYLTPDRVCNLTAARRPFMWDGAPQTWWVVFDLQCMTFSGRFRHTRNVLYVYTACPSYGSGVTIADYSALPSEHTSIRSGNAQSLQVVRSNDPTAAANGIGPAETWLRVAPLASPAPYSCAANIYSKPWG